MNRETIVSLEGDDLGAMISEVVRFLNSGDDKSWIITNVNADLSLIAISSVIKPEWVPGKWRARITAQSFGEDAA